MLWALLNCILRFQPQLLDGTLLFLAKRIEIGLGGAVLGLILFLFLSGGFSAAVAKKQNDVLSTKPQT